MRRRRKWLWWAKWAGTGMCILVALALVGSVWCRFGFRTKVGTAVVGVSSVGCSGGGIQGVLGPPSGTTVTTRDWFLERTERSVIKLLPQIVRFPMGLRVWFVPLWIPLVAIGIPTRVMFFLDRRRIPPNHCHKCGYNLTGNVSGVCPECGTQA